MFLLGGGARAESERNKIERGPLRISADETVSLERGKIIEAKGNVLVHYDMDSGDLISSESDFARYTEKGYEGEIWGHPRAWWFRKDPNNPKTTLTAERVHLDIKQSQLRATGHVRVEQGSSTLKAQEVVYDNEKKIITATGKRPVFEIEQKDQNTLISAEKIIALVNDKQIRFTDRVKGRVLMSPENLEKN